MSDIKLFSLKLGSASELLGDSIGFDDVLQLRFLFEKRDSLFQFC